MLMNQDLRFFNVPDPVPLLHKIHTSLHVLRLDLVHPVVSGNKWFKLKYYLAEALEKEKKILLSFGGPWSNHLVATAAACSAAGLKSIGIIRGERPPTLSHSLQEAMDYGMEMFFVSREEYSLKQIPLSVFRKYAEQDILMVPEGGYGNMGILGAREILELADTSIYTHIACATGTGTTLAGLVLGAASNQEVLGITALKNNYSIQEEINALLPGGKKHKFRIDFDYHFGGFGKHNEELLTFMNNWYLETGVPTDIVYTGKLFYALKALGEKGILPPSAKILAIHTGGLQGNRSLQKGKLIF